MGATLLPFFTGLMNDMIGIKYGLGITILYLFLIIPLLFAAQKQASP